MDISIINGPNLNLLGTREPGLYGNIKFDDYLFMLRNTYKEINIAHFQSNIEGELITAIQDSGLKGNGIILNAGGYTHTSVAIADAIAAIKTTVIEVHITNIYAREPERQISLLSKYCMGSITGLGIQVYELAILHLSNNLPSNGYQKR